MNSLFPPPFFCSFCSTYSWLTTRNVEQEPCSASTGVAPHGLLVAAMASDNLHWQWGQCGPSADYSKSSPDPIVHPSLALDAQRPPRPATSAFLAAEGFRIGFKRPPRPLKAAKTNLNGTYDHPEVVSNYLSTEVSLGRVADPFPLVSVPQVHISHFGVIPKGQMGKWRLIVDFSHPWDWSVNDKIPKHLCSLKYITIDEAIKGILQHGPGTLLAKIDIKSAFRLLPVYPGDRHMLGMHWMGGSYIDTCLPFGLCSAPKFFNIMADFLAWIVTQCDVPFLIHYLDDFFNDGSG